MPRTRTYTDRGYIEVQWSKRGRLVCIVSGVINPVTGIPAEDIHQFTERGDMGVLMRDLTRARKQAFSELVPDPN